MYEGYVPMEYTDCLNKISKSGKWGDHVMLQAAADSYGVKILVPTSFKDTCYIEILPEDQKSKRAPDEPMHSAALSRMMQFSFSAMNRLKKMAIKQILITMGAIDYEEFIAAMLHLNKINKDDHLIRTFSYFDKDGSGYIMQDVQRACEEFGIEDFQL